MLLELAGVRVFLKPGQGKTATVLKAFQILKKANLVDAMLVIAPLRVVTTSWPQQIDLWDDFKDMTYTLIHGGPEARNKAMGLDKDVYLMNVEGMVGKEWHPVNLKPQNKRPVWGPNPKALSWLKSKRVMLVVDESTRFKSYSSLRFQSLKTYLPFFNRRYILTGTPSPNTIEDLFSQCYITDIGKDLGQYITHFRSQYMQSDKSGFGYVALPGAIERVAAKIAPTTLDVKTEEVLPTINNLIWVDMPDETRKQYNELKRQFLTLIEGQEIMAPNAGVLFGKLRQIAQGAIYEPEKSSYIELFSGKLEALQSLLEELNGAPLFTLYQYNHDWQRAERFLGMELPRIGSGVSAAKGAELCRRFGRGELPLLFGHPLSVAHGIDGLQNNCADVCWFGGDPSWENFYQANLRIVRSGNTAGQVTIHQILTNCGVERAIQEILKGKQSGEAELLDALRNELKNE